VRSGGVCEWDILESERWKWQEEVGRRDYERGVKGADVCVVGVGREGIAASYLGCCVSF
jgi:hypothetical protein